MKRIISVVFALVMLITASAMSVCAQNELSVEINGKKIEFDVLPQIVEGRTMVPFRKIGEELGAKVDWDDSTKTVSLELNGQTVKLTIGKSMITVDGADKELDVPAMIIDGRTLVPVRAITEAFGCDVAWDDATKTVSLTVKEPETIEEIEGAVITMANAEAGSEKYGFLGSGCKFGVVPDPDNENNNVYFANATVTDKTSYTYIWFDTDFKAGQKYTVEYDYRVVSDAMGEDLENDTYIGTCFRFGTSAKPGSTDHAAGGVKVETANVGKWQHIKHTYTVPESYIPGNSRFGIYASPVNKTGVDFQVAVAFMIDNLSVVPCTDEDGAADSGNSESSFDQLKGIVYDFAEGNDGWVTGGCTSEVKDGVYYISTTSEQKDPSISKYDIKDINASNYKKIAIRFKYQPNSPEVERCNIFFATYDDPNLDEKKCTYMDYVYGSQDKDGYTWLVFDFTNKATWTGDIKTIRFDPAHDGGGSFEIDKIIIVAE